MPKHNDLLRCKFCNSEFLSQGYFNHVKSCKRKHLKSNESDVTCQIDSISNRIYSTPTESIDRKNHVEIKSTNYTLTRLNPAVINLTEDIDSQPCTDNVKSIFTNSQISNNIAMETGMIENFHINEDIVSEFKNNSSNCTASGNSLLVNEDFLDLTAPTMKDNGAARSRKTPCPVCNGEYVNVNLHISKAHGEFYRNKILEGFGCNLNGKLNSNSSDLNREESTPTVKATCTEYTKRIQDFISNFLVAITDQEFDMQVTAFVSFLSTAINLLPGPKHPAQRYYEARKRKTFQNNDRKMKDSTNPQRASNRDRNRRKAVYTYQKIQYLYYNQRRRAVKFILNGKQKKCPLSVDQTFNYFKNCFEMENNNCRVSYGNINNPANDGDTCPLITKDDILQAMRKIAIDTAAGPDKVIMRAVKSDIAAEALCIIANRIIQTGFIPKSFINARTVLVYKGGEDTDPGNWRPITISSILRRIILRTLEPIVRSYIELNCNQRGFVKTPGTYINTAIVDNVLKSACKEKKDATLVCLDVAKAFDYVGHKHLKASVNSSRLPQKLKSVICNLLSNSTTQVQINGSLTKHIKFKRGVLQGDPLSPILFNISIDHILNEISENSVAKTYGYCMEDGSENQVILGFADDLMIISKNKASAVTLTQMVVNRLTEIGLKLNINKCKAICVCKGQLDVTPIILDNDTLITSIQFQEKIKYLGVNFYQQIVFDQETIAQRLTETLNTLTTSPLLTSDQKLVIVNQFVAPTLTYAFQTTPAGIIPKDFLSSVDKIIRSAVREMLQLPGDTPNSMIYSPNNFKGLAISCASWEAYLQRLNTLMILRKSNVQCINYSRNFQAEERECLDKLNMLQTFDTLPSVKELRHHLRKIEFSKWADLSHKGKGVKQFMELPAANKWLAKKSGLSCSEWRDAIKMTANVIPVRAIPGKTNSTSRCRYCNEFESLAHVLGACPHGELLRTKRHNDVRTLIADALREKKLEVHEEIACIANGGSNRRVDILVIDRTTKQGFILDPTIRFEQDCDQASKVDVEKKAIYEPTINFFLNLYNLENIVVKGLYIGARGTITRFFENFRQEFGLNKNLIQEVVIKVLKGSIYIIRNHLYSSTP